MNFKIFKKIGLILVLALVTAHADDQFYEQNFETARKTNSKLTIPQYVSKLAEEDPVTNKEAILYFLTVKVNKKDVSSSQWKLLVGALASVTLVEFKLPDYYVCDSTDLSFNLFKTRFKYRNDIPEKKVQDHLNQCHAIIALTYCMWRELFHLLIPSAFPRIYQDWFMEPWVRDSYFKEYDRTYCLNGRNNLRWLGSYNKRGYLAKVLKKNLTKDTMAAIKESICDRYETHYKYKKVDRSPLTRKQYKFLKKTIISTLVL